MPPATSGNLAFFAHERGDARVRKRIAALGDQGWAVLGFTFHRVRDQEDRPPEWENIHLGTTYNRRYLQRVWALIASVGVLWSERARLRSCRVVYAINMDNALLAMLGMFLARNPAPLVLELADIQPAMVGQGMVSRVFRGIERFVLNRSALLVTTSPGFVREYFQPIQRFEGEIFLLENKVYPGGALPPARFSGVPVEGAKPWVVGCFGAFRCRRSLELMKALASGANVRFVLRGYPAGTIADEFAALIDGVRGISFEGAYHYPQDLAGMYEGVDFSWAFDESDPNGNSAWLLPNRIYEGGCFGVPAIAARATETGRWIDAGGLGWTFEEPLEESLSRFFGSLGMDEWSVVKRRCESRNRDEFTGDADYTRLSGVFEKLASQRE